MSSRVKPAADPRRRPRGRPPSLEAKQAILRAARDMLREGGPAAVTMEGLAARTGVGKPTIYRWWPDRHAVAMAALMEEPPGVPTGRSGRSPLRELRRQLHAIIERFSTATGRHVATMLAAADSESELAKAFRNQFIMGRRAEGAVLLREAVQAGEIARPKQIEVVVDLLYGPIVFRLLMGHAPLDVAFVDAVLDQVVRRR